MRIADAPSSPSARARRAPADPLFVRVVRAGSTGAAGTPAYESFESLRWDVELGRGVHRWTTERGLLRRDTAGAWTFDRRHIEASDDETADRVAAAVHAAYAGFLALGIAPGDHRCGQLPTSPDWLEVHADEATWRFDASDAPAQAWALLAASRR